MRLLKSRCANSRDTLLHKGFFVHTLNRQEQWEYEWDEAKCRANIAKHGVDFALARDFDFETALVTVDDRFDYGEKREIALGRIGGRIYVLAFQRREGAIRVISLRKANAREVTTYESKET